jgi:hypothetical protein
MKQIILSLCLLMTVSFSSLLANNGFDPNTKAEQRFKIAFPGAESVKWSQEGSYTKAVFLFYGRGTQALFNADGELLGSVRSIFYADLPVRVMMAVRKRFDNAIPFGITEVNRVDGTHYRFSVEKENKRHEASISPDGSFINVK